MLMNHGKQEQLLDELEQKAKGGGVEVEEAALSSRRQLQPHTRRSI